MTDGMDIAIPIYYEYTSELDLKRMNPGDVRKGLFQALDAKIKSVPNYSINALELALPVIDIVHLGKEFQEYPDSDNLKIQKELERVRNSDLKAIRLRVATNFAVKDDKLEAIEVGEANGTQDGV